jgi:chromate transporter
MTPESGHHTLLMLAWVFGVISLFAIGGANSAVPEMHRVAVDVHHWMNDRQFADLFALAQLSPGPNVLIVTLIGYHVGGLAGGLIATVAMCGVPAIVAYFVGGAMLRFRHAKWPALLQAALVPLSIGLMAASGIILSLTTGGTVAGAVMVAVAAIVAFTTRISPLWLLAAGGLLGFAGLAPPI